MIFMRPRTQVLMVCRENICRSPLAEGLLRHHLREAGLGRQVKVDSAGTRASQPGLRADPRAVRLAKDAGIKLGRIRAQRVTEKHLREYDLVLAMDGSNMEELLAICPADCSHKISLFLSHLPGAMLQEVPDPYYGSYEGFQEVYQLIDRAALSIAESFRSEQTQS